jgi:hypothetical protein
MGKAIEMQNCASEYERNELEEKIKVKGDEWSALFYEFEEKLKNLSPEQLDQVFELARRFKADPQGTYEAFEQNRKAQ